MNVNALQLYRGKKWSGLTDENSLATAFLTQPQMVNNALAYLFGKYNGNVLSLITGGLGRTLYVDNRQYGWRLAGELERPVSIVRNLGDGGSTPGLYNQTFRIVLASKDFVSGEILILDDRQYQVIVVADPIQDGDGYIYTLKLTGADQARFVPPALLTAGKQISKESSAFEEGSARSGITNYASPFEMRNHLTIQRKSYEVTGSAATDVMVIT